MTMTLEERVSELERRVAELERAERWTTTMFYPPVEHTPVAGGLDAVMAAEGYEINGVTLK